MKIIIEQYKQMTEKNNINYLKVLYNLLFNISFRVHILVYVMQESNSFFLKNIIFNRLQTKYSLYISPECSIGEGLNFMHFLGVVIGTGVVIGNNCIIYHQVTLGNKNGEYPKIGNNVTIYCGAKLLGGIEIGDNAVIGANSVVLKNVPENAIIVGIPAENVGKNIVTI